MENKETTGGGGKPSNDNNHESRNTVNDNREQPVHHDRAARHLSEIDRREGEMNHGETGFRGFDLPDNRA